VLWEIGHFRHYLCNQNVTIYTDHTVVLLNPNISGKHARWWLREVEIVHRAGKLSSNVDVLSCNPCGPAPLTGVEESEVQVASITAEHKPDQQKTVLIFQPTLEQSQLTVL